jgi:hypothetical protein
MQDLHDKKILPILQSIPDNRVQKLSEPQIIMTDMMNCDNRIMVICSSDGIYPG